jgi:hypothetical protein
MRSSTGTTLKLTSRHSVTGTRHLPCVQGVVLRFSNDTAATERRLQATREHTTRERRGGRRRLATAHRNSGSKEATTKPDPQGEGNSRAAKRRGRQARRAEREARRLPEHNNGSYRPSSYFCCDEVILIVPLTPVTTASALGFVDGGGGLELGSVASTVMIVPTDSLDVNRLFPPTLHGR